jgi:hypothetical protein
MGVSTRTLLLWARQGLLTPHRIGDRRTVHYRVSDLQLLRRARAEKSTDIWHVKALALQALSAARATELRLLEVFNHLGLNSEPLERDDDSICILYQDAEAGATTAQLLDPTWVRFWGGTFFAMDEVYLELVQRATANDEPWKHFMDFTNTVMRTAMQPGGSVEEALRASEELQLAYKYFQGGARHLWYVGYMYCRRSFGKRVADVVFDGSRSAVDELMAILH